MVEEYELGRGCTVVDDVVGANEVEERGRLTPHALHIKSSDRFIQEHLVQVMYPSAMFIVFMVLSNLLRKHSDIDNSRL
jgi:hypothetical protein